MSPSTDQLLAEIDRLRVTLVARDQELCAAYLRQARTEHFLRQAQRKLGILPSDPAETARARRSLLARCARRIAGLVPRRQPS